VNKATKPTGPTKDPWQDPSADPWSQWKSHQPARAKATYTDHEYKEYKEFQKWKAEQAQATKDPNQVAMEARRSQLHTEMALMDSVIHACSYHVTQVPKAAEMREGVITQMAEHRKAVTAIRKPSQNRRIS